MSAELLEEGLQAGMCRPINPEMAASMLFGAFQNVVLDWVADDCSYPLVERADELADFVLEGVCRRLGAPASLTT